MGKLIRNGIEYGGGNGTDIFEVTQAEYDALVQAGTLVHNALYVITDAPNLNATAQDISYDGSTDTVWDKVESKADTATTLAGYGITNAYTKDNIDSNNVRKYATGWGTTCETTLGRYQFIVIRGASIYVVWLASTNDVNVTNVGTNSYVTGTGSATLDNVTFTRLSNNNLKVTLTSSGTITIFG